MSVRANPTIRHVTLDDGRTVFDEFVAYDADIHFEAMGEAQFWMSVRIPDGRMWFINCGAVNNRAKGYANCELVEGGDMPSRDDYRRDRYARALLALDRPITDFDDDLTDHGRAQWRARADRFIAALEEAP